MYRKCDFTGEAKTRFNVPLELHNVVHLVFLLNIFLKIYDYNCIISFYKILLIKCEIAVTTAFLYDFQ